MNRIKKRPSSCSSTLPTISNYGQYASGNYGAHTLRVQVGPIALWFSYQTVVAFRAPGYPQVVHDNVWGPTTGKHLNWIDGGDYKNRVSSEDFQRLYDERVAPLLGEKVATSNRVFGIGIDENGNGYSEPGKSK